MKCNECNKKMVNLGQTNSGHWGFGCFNPNCIAVGELIEVKFEDLKA